MASFTSTTYDDFRRFLRPELEHRFDRVYSVKNVDFINGVFREEVGRAGIVVKEEAVLETPEGPRLFMPWRLRITISDACDLTAQMLRQKFSAALRDGLCDITRAARDAGATVVFAHDLELSSTGSVEDDTMAYDMRLFVAALDEEGYYVRFR